MKVFLSHSSLDKRLARRLARDLEAVQIEVWLDQWDIQVGEDYVKAIERGLDNSNFIIVLLTPNSMKSIEVEKEWRSRIEHEASTRNIAVVPVVGEPCRVPDFLAQRGQANIAGGSYPLGFRHLLSILGHYGASDFVLGREKPKLSMTMIPVVTPIALEVSADLIPVVAPDDTGRNRFLDDLLSQVRRSLESEFGFSFPGVRIRGNETDMPPGSVLIMIDEIPLGMFNVRPDDVLADADVDELAAHGLPGEACGDRPGRTRIAAADRPAAEAAGFIVHDAAEYMAEILHAVLRGNAAEFVDIDKAGQLVDAVRTSSPELVADTVPKLVSWVALADVFARLVEEEIGITDVGAILSAFLQHARSGDDLRDTVITTEWARQALKAQITAKFLRGERLLRVVELAPEIEALFSDAIVRTSGGSYLNLDPEITNAIMEAITASVSASEVAAGVPVLVANPAVRRYVRKLMELRFPSMPVVSRADIEGGVPLETLKRIDLDGRGVPGRDGAPA